MVQYIQTIQWCPSRSPVRMRDPHHKAEDWEADNIQRIWRPQSSHYDDYLPVPCQSRPLILLTWLAIFFVFKLRMPRFFHRCKKDQLTSVSYAVPYIIGSRQWSCVCLWMPYTLQDHQHAQCWLQSNILLWLLGFHLSTWINLNPTWISNHKPSNVGDEITYPFPNFNGYTVDVWEWISNFYPHLRIDVITYLYARIKVNPGKPWTLHRVQVTSGLAVVK